MSTPVRPIATTSYAASYAVSRVSWWVLIASTSLHRLGISSRETGAALAAGQLAGLGDAERLERVVDRARRGERAAGDGGEGRQLGAVGRQEALHERPVARAGRVGRAGLGRGDGERVVVADADRALAAEDLHAHVVAGAVVAGGGERHERAVVERQDGRGGVDVAGLGEERRALVGAGRVDRGDLAAGDEADDVEVVDRAVAEEAAARRDVGGVGRRLVVRLGPDAVQEAELAAGDGLLGALVAAVETSLEADVDGRGRPRRRARPGRASRRASRRPASRRRWARRPRGRGG